MRITMMMLSFFLFFSRVAFSENVGPLEVLDKVELVHRLGVLVPEVINGALEIGSRRRICSYFKHVFDNGRSFYDNVNDLSTSENFIRFQQCCPNIGSSQVSILSNGLADTDPLPTLPESRRKQIKITESILHSVTQDRDFSLLMSKITQQVQESSKEEDKVACVPLAATFALAVPSP